MAHNVLQLVAILLALLSTEDARAGNTFDQERCSLCHVRESVFFNPSFLSPQELQEFDEPRLCGSCHNGSVQDSRASIWRGAQHPAAGGPKARRCSHCHSPHSKGGWGVLAGTGVSLSRGGEGVCGGCHASYSGTGGIHRGIVGEKGCGECHQAHGGDGKALLRDPGVALCLRCHADKSGEKTGGHPVAVAIEGTGGAARMPGCTICHPPHRKGEPAGSASARCAGCHPFGGNIPARSGKRHAGEGECTGCHTFHARSGEGGKGFRGSDIRAEALCRKCHEPFWAGDVLAGRAAGTHVAVSGPAKEGLCGRCHKLHDGEPGTPLLRSGKAYFCLECHEGQNTIRETGGTVLAHPVFEKVASGRLTRVAKEKGIALGSNGEIVCGTCHKMHGAVPGTPLLVRGTEKDEYCFWCHEGVRGNSHRKGAKAQVADCAACHPVHGKRVPGTDPWSTLCQTCHPRASLHLAGSKDRTVGRSPSLPDFDSRGRKSEYGAISCPTCHQTHGEAGEPGLLRKNYRPNAFLCTSCHQKEETIALTPHDLRGISGNSVCEPCHLPHGGSSPRMWGIRKKEGAAAGEDTCGACHEATGIGTPIPKGGHPRNIVAARPMPHRFPLLGADGALSRSGVISCPTCHEVHGTGMIPAGQGTGKLLRAPDSWGNDTFCTACHEGKGIRHGKADCQTCHPPHAEERTEMKCASCHADRSGGLLARHLEAGKGCGSCHRIHEVAGRGNGAQRKKGAGACYVCHPAARKIEGTSHAEIGASTCDPCHPVHRDLPKEEFRPKLGQEFFAPDLLCTRCHREGGDAPPPSAPAHPIRTEEVPTNYGAKVTLESPIVMTGRHTEGGQPLFPLFNEEGRQLLSGRMGCLTCHNPHAGAGGEEKNVYLRDPTMAFLAELCSQCHRGEGVARVKGFHRIPRKRP